MALADIPTNEQSRRLDSWKEIAEYLGRDVRTATRWESLGMPVRRVPGGKGASVFAFTNEIDDWRSGSQPEAAGQVPTIATTDATPRSRARPMVMAGVVSALTLSFAALVFVMGRAARSGDIATMQVTMAPTGISITSESGPPRPIHRFQPDSAVSIRGTSARITDLDSDGTADIMAGISYFTDSAGRMTRGGELLNLSPDGQVRWRFAFDDVLAFRDGQTGGPWALSEWQSIGGAPNARIAVAAHDYVWWASMVAVLDHQGRRQNTFVNPGWMESLLWLGADRLAAAGFHNPRNEAMLAVIDPAAGGQTPGSEGTEFACISCSANPPLFYATFPRSELNLLTGSPFNRAQVALIGDRVLVTTSETENSTGTAIYEFDRDLRFVRARYSEAYWDEHGRLERENRLTHTRGTCPQRDGPSAIHIWDTATGRWETTTAGTQPR